MRYQNISVTLAIVADCRRKQEDGTVGTMAVVSQYGSGLHAHVECKLTSQTTNSETDKKRRHQYTSSYFNTLGEGRKVQTKANTSNTFMAVLLRSCGCGFVFMRIKTIQTRNKNFILKHFRYRDGKRTETRIGMEGIHSCIPPLLCVACTQYTVECRNG